MKSQDEKVRELIAQIDALKDADSQSTTEAGSQMRENTKALGGESSASARSSPVDVHPLGKAGLKGSGQGNQLANGKQDLVDLSTSLSPRPELRLHAYAREPRKRRTAEALFALQKGECAWSKSDRGVCGGIYFEIDHLNGNPKDGRPENLQLLCKSHHTVKTNEDRARLRRSPARVCESPGHASNLQYPTSDASLEDQKRENWQAKFQPWIRDLMHGPFREIGGVISYAALVGLEMDALEYTDSFGDRHIPSEATAQRYIREECIRPKGCLQFCTRNGVKSVEFVGDRGKTKMIEEVAEE